MRSSDWSSDVCSSDLVDRGVLELEADLFGDDLTTGEDRDVLQLGLATVAEAGSLDGSRLEDATDLVEHERREGLALDVLSDDEELLALLDPLVDDRQDRQSVVQGKSGSVRVDLGGRRIIQQKKKRI